MFTHIPPISILLALLVVLSGCATERTMILTPSLYTETATPLFGDLDPELIGDRLPILYATDRLPEQHESSKRLRYGSERSPSGALGVAEVRIENGSSEAQPDSRPAIEIESVEELVRFPATPYLYRVGDRGRIQIDPDVAAELEQTKAQARQEILKRLALTPKKEVILDVHGVATQFDQAVLGLAEFWHFLGREGVPIAYTWPAGSKGLIFYTVDRESGEFTVLHLKQFIRFLAGMPEIERIHISAHSRGTDVVITALRELIIEARAKGLKVGLLRPITDPQDPFVKPGMRDLEPETFRFRPAASSEVAPAIRACEILHESVALEKNTTLWPGCGKDILACGSAQISSCFNPLRTPRTTPGGAADLRPSRPSVRIQGLSSPQKCRTSARSRGCGR